MWSLKVASVFGAFVAVLVSAQPEAQAVTGGADTISRNDCRAMGWRYNADATCAPLDGACFALEQTSATTPPESESNVDLYWLSTPVWDNGLARYVGTADAVYYRWGPYPKKTAMQNLGCYVVNLKQRTIDSYLCELGRSVRTHFGALWDAGNKSFCDEASVTKSFYDTNQTIASGSLRTCPASTTSATGGTTTDTSAGSSSGGTTSGTTAKKKTFKPPLNYQLPKNNPLQLQKLQK